MRHYADGYAEALEHLFPEIGIQKDQFKPRKFIHSIACLYTYLCLENYWSDTRRRKQFLDSFAHKEGFDPHVPANWYSIQVSNIAAWKGGYHILELYNNRLSNALADIYPLVQFDPSKFESTTGMFRAVLYAW